MSNINFLPEQLKILESNDKNIIVSASAGSGKTTVMIEKLIKIITEENIDIKNLLVLTYTKSAAEEMKQKLINALYEKAESNIKYISQIDDVMTADISTLHSFFQKLIKKHFMLVDVDPKFCVLEENQSENLKYQALKKAISVYGEEKREKLNMLLDIYGKSRSEKTIYKLLDKINIFLSAVDNADNWSKTVATKLCESNLNENYAIKVVNKSFYETAMYYLSVFDNLLKTAEQQGAIKFVEYINNIISQLSFIKLNGNYGKTSINLKTTEIINNDQQIFDENINFENQNIKEIIIDSLEKEIFEEQENKTASEQTEYKNSFFENFSVYKNFDFKTLKQDADFLKLYEKIVFHRDKLKDYINKLKICDYTKENVIISIENVKEIIETLLELNTCFEKEYSLLKKSINALDFNDLEKFALKLSENKEICTSLSKKFAYIFIDEFQDANRLQERILSAFAGGNKRFMVGDVKQSIYGFRQAEPDIFLEIQSIFKKSDNSEVMFLNSNFRSHKKILEFVNIVFNEIMTLETAKLDYKNTAQLEGRLEFSEDESANLPRVELNLIKFPEKPEKPSAPPVYSVREHSSNVLQDGIAEKEAILTAEKISNLVGTKYFNISEKTFKEIQFKDISVLLNARGSYLDKFCSVLTGFNIPIYANTNASLLNDEEVNVFICLLRLCRNFNDDISLAVCLNSIFGGLSYSELGQIRLAGLNEKNKTDLAEQEKQIYNEKLEIQPANIDINQKNSLTENHKLNNEENLKSNNKKSSNNFFECVLSYESKDAIFKKLQNFKNLLNQIKFDIGYKGIYFALNKVINQFDYYSYLYAKNNGLEKVNKIKKFLQDFKNSEFNFNLVSFLDYADENPDSIKAPNYVSGDNCVNITTIHSSKGLEYPVVILANAGAEFTGQRKNSEIEINLNEGIALQFYNSEVRTKNMSVMFDAMLKMNKSAEFAEKLRLLYVALTRAKNYLIIMGSFKDDFSKLNSGYEIKQKTNFLELIVGALPKSEIENINSNNNIKNEIYNINIYNSEKIFTDNLKNKKSL
ncbi:MAG: UvrD-helicase domain-containing protein, partial [Clostridia bacterium]|nr:UvrD-helicase domain-containing protein [Clostridia bacterium]